jgi:EmrB/QacA subfamily drug resistance transporter
VADLETSPSIDLEVPPTVEVSAVPPKRVDPSASVDGAEEPVQHPKRWFIFGIVATAMMMGSLDQTVVATALPTLHKELHSPINWVGWTVTVYQLGQVIAMPVAGRISDQFGRKRVFVTCVALFAISSLLCGLAQNIDMLIVFRGVQALGAGAFMPSATGIVADHFGRDRDRGIGLFTSIVPIGSLLGPVIGGVIIYYWEWRGVFLINLPIAAVVFVLAIVVIPRSKQKDVAHADLLGIGMLVCTILPLMFAITMLGNGSTTFSSPVVLFPALVAIAVGYVFIRRSLRIEAPIIPIPLLRTRAFATMNFISFMYGGCVLGFGALVPLYAEDRYNFVSIQAGTLLTARGVGALCLAATSAYLLRRTGYRLPMVVGFGLAATGMLLLGFGAHGVTPYVWLAVAAALMGLGNGIAAPATNNATLSFAPGEVASIAGLRGMFRQIGAIVAISVTTAIVARSSHPGIQLGHSFMVFALIVFCVVIPLVFTVPNRRGTW